MIKLLIVPQDIMAAIEDQDISRSIFMSISKMIEALSMQDIAEIAYFHERQQFDTLTNNVFGGEQQTRPIEIHPPIKTLIDEYEDGRYSYQFEQALTRVRIKEVQDETVYIPVYSLYPVEETLWVAAMQRQRHEEGDPRKVFLAENSAFYNALVAQLLMNHPLEKVATTEVFGNYLKSVA